MTEKICYVFQLLLRKKKKGRNTSRSVPTKIIQKTLLGKTVISDKAL